MGARPQLGDPEPGGCEGSSCLRGALESTGWNGLLIALTSHRGCGYLDSVTESALGGLCRKPHFHFRRDLRSAVKLPLKLFNLKASDKEQALCLARCTLTLQNFPSSSFSP